MKVSFGGGIRLQNEKKLHHQHESKGASDELGVAGEQINDEQINDEQINDEQPTEQTDQEHTTPAIVFIEHYSSQFH